MSHAWQALSRRHVLFAFFLVVLIWGAHFWHIGGFGLYEDDYGLVSPAFDMSAQEMTRGTVREVVLATEGRPFHRSLMLGLSFLGMRAGGLHAIHVIGFFIITANALLFFWLLQRLTHDEVVVVTGTLAFALFPSDTTRAFLTHSLGVQPSLLFLLVALHLYLSSRRFLAYAAALCSLLCYETFFPVFFAAPLLRGTRLRETRKELVTHALVMFGMVALAVGLRTLKSDYRIAGLGPLALVWGGANLVLGPLVSLGLFVYRSLEAFRGAPVLGLDWILVAASFALLPSILLGLQPGGGEEALRRAPLVDASLLRLEMPAGLRPLASLATRGAVMLVLAYPFTLTVPAIAVAGRATRVHAAAALGAGIVIGCLSAGVLLVATALGRRHIAAALLAFAFATLVASGLRVQADYVASWSQQRSFWRQVVALCPDLGDRTVILADVGGLPGARPMGDLYFTTVLAIPQIRTFSWSLDLVLPQMFRFPAVWRHPPRVYQVRPGWAERLEIENGRLRLNEDILESPPAAGEERVVDLASLIVLESHEAKLARRTQPLCAGGATFALRSSNERNWLVFPALPLALYLNGEQGH